MILVTGASGTIGRHVVSLLLEAGAPVRALTRDPARVPAGPEVVRGDFDDPASLRRATDGADRVLLITAPPEQHERHDLALLRAARDTGVKHVVKLSAIGTGIVHQGREIAPWHARAEEALRSSGLAWTILRPSLFASNTLWWVPAIRGGAPVPDLVGGAEQGVIDPRDVSAVAAAVLTGDGHHGALYTLTGPERLSVAGQAAILGELVGRPIAVEEAEAPAALASGMDWARAGHNAVVTDDVRRVLGREPGTFRRWARDHRAAFGD